MSTLKDLFNSVGSGLVSTERQKAAIELDYKVEFLQRRLNDMTEEEKRDCSERFKAAPKVMVLTAEEASQAFSRLAIAAKDLEL
jgi:chaperonin cofactor prefoldin